MRFMKSACFFSQGDLEERRFFFGPSGASASSLRARVSFRQDCRITNAAPRETMEMIKRVKMPAWARRGGGGSSGPRVLTNIFVQCRNRLIGQPALKVDLQVFYRLVPVRQVERHRF